MFKPKFNKDIVLKPMVSDAIFDLMFLKENDGFFREDSTATSAQRLKYIDFLKKASERWVRYSIFYKGVEAGFILTAGVDCRLVGGILPEFQRKGIYSVARNTIVYDLNQQKHFIITSSVDKSNTRMKKFLAGMTKTHYIDDLSINHFNPNVSIAKIEDRIEIDRTITPEALYAIRDGLENETYNGSNLPFYPSPELAFKAAWHRRIANEVSEPLPLTHPVLKLNDKAIKSLTGPDGNYGELGDAHFCVEYVSSHSVSFDNAGTVTFKVINEEMNDYVGYNGELNRKEPHSPKDVEIVHWDTRFLTRLFS